MTSYQILSLTSLSLKQFLEKLTTAFLMQSKCMGVLFTPRSVLVMLSSLVTLCVIVLIV